MWIICSIGHFDGPLPAVAAASVGSATGVPDSSDSGNDSMLGPSPTVKVPLPPRMISLPSSIKQPRLPSFVPPVLPAVPSSPVPVSSVLASDLPATEIDTVVEVDADSEEEKESDERPQTFHWSVDTALNRLDSHVASFVADYPVNVSLQLPAKLKIPSSIPAILALSSIPSALFTNSQNGEE